jgi:hypothetical protein
VVCGWAIVGRQCVWRSQCSRRRLACTVTSEGGLETHRLVGGSTTLHHAIPSGSAVSQVYLSPTWDCSGAANLDMTNRALLSLCRDTKPFPVGPSGYQPSAVALRFAKSSSAYWLRVVPARNIAYQSSAATNQDSQRSLPACSEHPAARFRHRSVSIATSKIHQAHLRPVGVCITAAGLESEMLTSSYFRS